MDATPSPRNTVAYVPDGMEWVREVLGMPEDASRPYQFRLYHTLEPVPNVLDGLGRPVLPRGLTPLLPEVIAGPFADAPPRPPFEWSRRERRLTYRGRLVKKYAGRRAERQEAVLRAFHDAGWTGRIPYPKEFTDDQMASSTVFALNAAFEKAGLGRPFRIVGESRTIVMEFNEPSA